MKSNKNHFMVSKLTIAVQGALVAMLAMPLAAFSEDYDAATLTHPTNSVEIGADFIPKSAEKFGEYNGLNRQGANLIGSFNLRGGDAYNAYNGGSGTSRWELKGTDIGTTSGEVSGNMSNQGKWSLGIGYDELRHNITNTYQTPFQGTMGGNNFTLPANFGVINTTNTIASGYKGADSLTAAQLANFRSQDVYTDRKNSTFNAKFLIDPHWDVKFDFSHLEQSGAKLQGVAGDQVNIPFGSAYTWAGQTPLVIMNPTNYTTDNFNLALNWVGDQSYASASYFSSAFRDGFNGVSFNNPFVKTAAPVTGTLSAFPVDTMSTMPNNDFNQLNLSGGYSFTSATKLVGGLSYARNTQGDAYSNSGLTPLGVPQNSLNGLVVSTHADMKLTNQTSKDLALSAALKYNERDNQTASNSYQFNTINEAAGSALGLSVNAPMSNRKTQIELAGDYRIDKNQKLNLSYEHEQIKRWCNNAAANNQQGTLNVGYNGPWTYSVAACAQVPDSKEDKLAANYKLKASDNVSLNAGYGYSSRKSDFNSSFYNPMQAVGGGAGGEGFEVAGFVAFFQASRKEQLLKAGVNWQAGEKFSLGLNGRYTDDKYDSTYGVKNGQSWSLNLDAIYSQDENSSVSAYLTSQNSNRDMTNLQGAVLTNANGTTLNIPVGATWTNNLRETDLTFGLGTKQGGFLGGKLEIAGDLTYSLGNTSYGTNFNYASATAGGFTCSSPQFLTCGDLPDIKNETVQLKLGGSYKVDKSSKFKLGYMYQHLASTDYFYTAYQYGGTPTTMLPTNQQAPSYSVNVISGAYIYSF